jgi:cyclopropane fatty-acyl-phospholipid synthase-like methyltransferase
MYPAAALRLRPDDDLLDVACGSGSFLATAGWVSSSSCTTLTAQRAPGSA